MRPGISPRSWWLKWNHTDAAHGTGRNTQLTPGTFFGNYGMSLFSCTHDSVYGAGEDTQRTAYTGFLVDKRNRSRFWETMSCIEWLRAYSQQFSQLDNTSLSTRRALINIRQAFRDGCCIRPAASKAALAALGLRQNIIDFRYELIFCHPEPKAKTCLLELQSACPISRTR